MELRVKKITWSFTLEQNKTSIFKFKPKYKDAIFMFFFFFLLSRRIAEISSVILRLSWALEEKRDQTFITRLSLTKNSLAVSFLFYPKLNA